MKDAVIKLSELSKEELSLLRQFVTNGVTQCTSLCADSSGAALVKMFTDLKGEYNDILSKLPPSDMVPAAQEASWNLRSFLSVLSSTQAILAQLTNQITAMKTGQAGTVYNAETLALEVDKIINDRVSKGLLFPKETVTTMCSEAKKLGLDEGSKTAREEATQREQSTKLAGERKAALTKNSLPIPADDALLLGDEAAFKAFETKTTTRFERLKKAGVALNSPAMARIHAIKDDAEFDEFAKILEDMKAGAKGGDEPFNKPPEGAPTGRRILMV
jgi:hypothetical protein